MLTKKKMRLKRVASRYGNCNPYFNILCFNKEQNQYTISVIQTHASALSSTMHKIANN